MTVPPLFSVIVPSYGRHQALARCLQGLANQNLPPAQYEVIVVDDGSLQPVTIPPAMRVTLIRQQNRGPAAARNTGAKAAQGAWLVFTDDDCVPEPDWLAKLAEAAVHFPHDLLGGRVVNALFGNTYAAASQLLIDYLYGVFGVAAAGSRLLSDVSLPVQPFFTSNNLAVRREAFWQMGGFAAEMRLAAGEDRELCWRWQQGGGRLTAVPGAVVYHYHALTLRLFWRQHFTYGRGAWDFHRRRGGAASPAGWGFYYKMLAYPWKVKEKRPLYLSTLLCLSQIANASGYFWQKWRQSRERLEIGD
ncbi:MAG: hypothetical protein Kow0080_28950 [Candidatus Promineifilaceae bacterium]